MKIDSLPAAINQYILEHSLIIYAYNEKSKNFF